MHWICFHFEFEHSVGNYNPDEPCLDPNCPWNQIKRLKEILKNKGIDYDKELSEIIRKKYDIS